MGVILLTFSRGDFIIIDPELRNVLMFSSIVPSLIIFVLMNNPGKKCSYAISLQGRRKSVRKSSIRAILSNTKNSRPDYFC